MVDSAPPPCLARERVDVARQARRQSKAFDEYFFRNLKKVLKRSHVKSRSGQRPKSSLFVLSATETGLITAVYPNFAKRRLKG